MVKYNIQLSDDHELHQIHEEKPNEADNKVASVNEPSVIIEVQEFTHPLQIQRSLVGEIKEVININIVHVFVRVFGCKASTFF